MARERHVFVEEPEMDWGSLFYRATAGKQIAIYSRDPALLREWLLQVSEDLALVIKALKAAHDAHPP